LSGCAIPRFVSACAACACRTPRAKKVSEAIGRQDVLRAPFRLAARIALCLALFATVSLTCASLYMDGLGHHVCSLALSFFTCLLILGVAISLGRSTYMLAVGLGHPTFSCPALNLVLGVVNSIGPVLNLVSLLSKPLRLATSHSSIVHLSDGLGHHHCFAASLGRTGLLFIILRATCRATCCGLWRFRPR
jgi:hypothetical protein